MCSASGRTAACWSAPSAWPEAAWTPCWSQNRYLGTISIGDIRHWGRELTSIEPLIRQTARTVRVGDEAKESFDYLLDSGANYVVVLNADDTIAGIVTKTSVARSVAENLWGDSK